ncbi:MAG: alpha/beta hydrolase family protein [Bryobacteraceae bacterium]
MRTTFCFAALAISFAVEAQTQNPPPAPASVSRMVAGIPVNYDEALVGTYQLPDPLKMDNGKPVRTARMWTQKRRPEIVHLFEENQYGRAPGRPADMSFDVFDTGTPAMDGKAIRRQVTIYFSKDKNGPKEDLVVYIPAGSTKPVPLLLCIDFLPNSSTFEDPGIKLGEMWSREHKRVPAQRGGGMFRLKIDNLLAQGYGVAGVYYGDIDPDFLGGLPYGVRALYLKPGQTEPAPDEWGAIAAWGWGLSRAMDYLETDNAVDASRVGIYGVSRLGKTVMWAGARDTRFALVIASCSGEGGAALSRRNYGETIAHLTAPTRYPYQFCANYARYANHVDQLPVDANMLVALMAPRPVLLQTGSTDYWSDPKGEFLAAVAAGPVFRLFGKQGLGTDVMPLPSQPILHTIGYYMHEGGHGTLPGDWPIFLEFMDMHLKGGR